MPLYAAKSIYDNAWVAGFTYNTVRWTHSESDRLIFRSIRLIRRIPNVEPIILGVTRQRKWQLDKLAGGMCSICGKVRQFNTTLCDSCYFARKTRASKRYSDKIGSAPRATRCGNCGTTGHNRRTCEK